MNDYMYGVLNPEQLDNLCQRFRIAKSSLVPIFSGWHKRILLADELVFLFPREPQFQSNLDKEIEVYKNFNVLNGIQYPRLIDDIQDRNISDYRFAVVSRLKGIPLSEIIEKLSIEKLCQFFFKLGESIANVHNLDIANTSVFKTKISKPNDILTDLLAYIMITKDVEPALKILAEAISIETNYTIFGKEELNKIGVIIEKIINLPDVLTHGDIHEDQILLSNAMSITGILDWETAQHRNPIHDFNFGEWGMQIWDRLPDLFEIRKSLWEGYVQNRKQEINLTSDEFHIFWLIIELSWMYKQREKGKIGFTSKSFKQSIEDHIKEVKKVGKF